MGERLSSGAFVGREAELGRLDDALTEISETGASAVLIGGDAGIGKSRLVDEFCRRARTRGALVATGHCTPAEGGGLPYGPIIGAVRDASRQLSTADSARIFGPVRRVLGLDGSLSHDTALGLVKTNLFEAALESFEKLSEPSPVVLAFDDLQWADSASVEMIDFLIRNLAGRPLLLISTYRTDEIEPSGPLRRLIAEHGRRGRAIDIELGGLNRDEVAQLLAGILGKAPDWALVEAVVARSGGNPFFAEELAAARNATTLPTSLRNVVMLRVDRMSKEARHVVGFAAVAGDAIHHRLLSAAVGVHPDEIDVALAEAVDHQVLVADTGADRFRFRHAILREAVYDSLLPGERSRAHNALALALSDAIELGSAAEHAFELADHWWSAGQWVEAFDTSVRAGEQAARLLAMTEAHAYLERALIAHERGQLGESRPVDLLMKAADAAYLTSDPRRSVELIREAIEILQGTGESRKIAICYAMLARNAWAAGDSVAATDALHRGVAVLPPEPTKELAGLLAEEARILMLTSHREAAELKCEQAIAVARTTAARVEESSALITAGCCLAERGDIDGGIASIRAGMAIAAEAGSADQLNRAYGNLGYVLAIGSRLVEAVAIASGGDEDITHLNGVRLSVIGENYAEALLRLGRFDEASQLMQRISDRGVGSCVFGPNGVRANIAIRTARFDDAAHFLAEAETLSEGINTVQVSGALHIMRAELALERDDPASALAEIDHALGLAAGTEEADVTAEMCALGVRAIVDEFAQGRARGRRVDSEKARRQAADLVNEAEALVARRDRRGHPCSPRLLALVAQCQAEASRLGEPQVQAQARLWANASERWDTATEPYPATYCRWREAEALLSGRGERKRAVDALQQAWRTAVQIGAPALRARAERLAARARINLELPDADSGSTIASDLGLTAREVEVLAQLALGRTDRQIAEELFISRKTASVHVSNVLRKLDVASRVEAGEIGQRAGLST